MRYRAFDLNLLVALRILIEEQHIGRAAGRLALSQAATSGVLARLREHFDDPLLVREGRRMVLTPLAEQLLDPLSGALEQIEALTQARAEFRPDRLEREFHLVSSDHIAGLYLAPLLRRMAAEAPGIRVCHVYLDTHSRSQFAQGRYDLLVCPPPEIMGPRAALSGRPHALLFEDRYVCVVSAENADVGETLTLQDYLSRSHVVPIFGDAASGAVEAALAAAGHRQITVAEIPFALVGRMVVGTPYVATLPRQLAEFEAAALPLRIVSAPSELPRVVEHMYWHPHRDADPADRWLRQALREVIAEVHGS